MTSTLTVPQKEIPVLLDCDVLVVGAGASGFAAAVSASRAGAEIVLAEKNHYPGGVATRARTAQRVGLELSVPAIAKLAGAATAVGALAVIQPVALVPMFLVWVVTLVLTGWVGLATVLATLSLLPAFAFLGLGAAAMAFACLLALFILFTHRENIVRLARGTENRFERIRLKNWFRRD